MYVCSAIMLISLGLIENETFKIWILPKENHYLPRFRKKHGFCNMDTFFAKKNIQNEAQNEVSVWGLVLRGPP